MRVAQSDEAILSVPPVIIVGAGPVGLSLAGDLGWRGIPSIVVEQSDGTIDQPKMDGVNVRTMEFCRRWGINDQVHNCGYPRSYPQDMVYLTSFAGYELGREAFLTPSGGGEELHAGVSPEVRARCPQNLFDPILRRFAESVGTVDLRYQTRFLAVENTADGVTVEIEDLTTGRCSRLAGSYLVGCDGAESGIRNLIGARMDGAGSLTFTTNVIFRCVGLQGRHNKALGYRHVFIGPEGTWATCVAISGGDDWRLSIIANASDAMMSHDDIRAAIDRVLGSPMPYEVVSVMRWVRRELIADRYRLGRVFIVGDAAHVMSPTGGFGMNTGIADAVDLSWKLAGTLRGWAGKHLLNSYEQERRPVAQRAAREASGNLKRTLSPGPNPQLLDPSLAGALLRYEVGRRYSATMLREWYKLGIDLGYVYADSPICWLGDAKEPAEPEAAVGARTEGFANGSVLSPSLIRHLHKLAVHEAEGYPIELEWTELPAAEAMVYRPSTAAGARAPHAWMTDGRSTLDLFGKGFTLLVLGRNAPSPDPFAEAAEQLHVPFATIRCDESTVVAAYTQPLVLVRPDGHVAWSGRKWPSAGAAALVDRVRGAAAPNEVRLTRSTARFRATV